MLSPFPAIFVDFYAASLYFSLISFKFGVATGKGGRIFSSEIACIVSLLISWSLYLLSPKCLHFLKSQDSPRRGLHPPCVDWIDGFRVDLGQPDPSLEVLAVWAVWVHLKETFHFYVLR